MASTEPQKSEALALAREYGVADAAPLSAIGRPQIPAGTLRILRKRRWASVFG